jgi:putative endonuclease
MTFLPKTELARWGEKLAKTYLEENKIEIVETNFRTDSGEVDLIGKQGERYIFFEVKTRQSIKYGYPEEAVSAGKLRHIEDVAWDYFALNEIEDVHWQIDVVSIIRNPKSEKYEISWIENVLE